MSRTLIGNGKTELSRFILAPPAQEAGARSTGAKALRASGICQGGKEAKEEPHLAAEPLLLRSREGHARTPDSALLFYSCCPPATSWPSGTHGHLSGPPKAIVRPKRSRGTDAHRGKTTRGDSQGEDSCVTMEVGLGMLHPQAKECGRLRAATRSWKRPGRSCPHPDLRLPPSRTGREKISVVLRPPICGVLLRQPQETDRDG